MKIQNLIGLLLVIILLLACGTAMLYIRKLYMDLALEAKKQGKKELYKIFRKLAVCATCIISLSVVGVAGILLIFFRLF